MKSPILPLLVCVIALETSAFAKEWVTVVAPGLKETVAPLLEARKTEGWNVTVLPMEAGTDLGSMKERLLPMAAKPGPHCLVLIGDAAPAGANFKVLSGTGKELRMKGLPTDLPWAEQDGKRAWEVGRLPARSAEEAKAMVQKILAWPGAQAAQMAFPLLRILGGNHNSAEFGTQADRMSNTISGRIIQKFPAQWSLDGAIHVDGSPWQIASTDLAEITQEMITSPATILAYMGHSGWDGGISKNTTFLRSADWRNLPFKGNSPGLFFTCGCFSCQLSAKGEAYGLAAMRAANGPPAVIGAAEESWAAMGVLTLEHILATLNRPAAPLRTGDIWEATLAGLEIGTAPPEFPLLDMVDGTQGQVPLDQQRLEHREMWTLLGDPAMSLVIPPTVIELASPVTTKDGAVLKISGQLPPGLPTAKLSITLERHPSSVPSNLPKVPATGKARLDAARESRKLSNNVTIASAETTAEGGKFTTAIPLLGDLPPKPWTVRVQTVGLQKAAGWVQIK
jgi:hypothetical protein